MLVKGSGSAVGASWEQGREEANQEKSTIKQLRKVSSEPELRSGYKSVETLHLRTCSLPELSAIKTASFEAGGMHFYSVETFVASMTHGLSMNSPAERVDELDAAGSLPENNSIDLGRLTMPEGVPPRTKPVKHEGWDKLPLSVDAAMKEPSPIEEQRLTELLLYRDEKNNRHIFWGKLESYSAKHGYGVIALRCDNNGKYEFRAGFYYDDVDNTAIHQKLGARRASDQLRL